MSYLGYREQVKTYINHYKTGIILLEEDRTMIDDDIQRTKTEFIKISEILGNLHNEVQKKIGRNKRKRLNKKIKFYQHILELIKQDRCYLEEQKRNKDKGIKACIQKIKKIAIC